MQQIDRVRCFSSQNAPSQINHCLLACESEDIEHIALADFLPAECNELIKHRLRIAQTALRAACDRVPSRRLQGDLFFSGDELQVLRDQVRRDAMEIESLTAA